MTVARNVAFGLEERRLPRSEIAAKVKAALALVGLETLAHRYPAQLSGGQQQRVALARTIAVEPKVLLLDEPLSNLDAKLRIEVRRDLRALQRRLGLTTIFVTHDQEEANSVSDRIAVMSEGRVQQVGAPIELYERPANLFVATFLGTANILEGETRSSGGSLFFEVRGGGRVALPAGANAPAGAKLMFRPQHAVLKGAGEGGLEGTISHREFLGASVRYGVHIGAALVLAEAPFTESGALRSPGDAVTLEIAPERLLLLSA
jgi:iron(III) transport system ATP-binding protein